MAEPLSILGGVAASIQLIECATGTLLGTINLVRELRGIPAKTASYVDDVERSSERLSYICRHILSSGSLAADHIGPASVARLSSVCDSLRKATNDAQANLEPLVEGLDSTKNKPALRLWNSLVSKMRESTIHEQLQRLDKLNLELIGEFNMVNLTSQVAIRSVLNETSAAMNNHQLKISEGIESLIELGRMSEASVQSMKSGLESKLDTMSKSHEIGLAITPTFSHQIGYIHTNVNSLTETANSIHHQTLRLDSGMQTQLRLNHDDMQKMMRSSELRLNTMLRSIRDEMIAAISAADARDSARVFQLGIDQLTATDRNIVQNNVAASLMRYPESLANAWHSSHRNRSRLKPCCCQPRTETSSIRVWNFQLQTFRKQDHRNNCPLRLSSRRSWNHSLSANLYPFLSRVVDVSLEAATGPGTWTIFPCLRVRRIIQRSESTVLAAFDTVLDSCAEKVLYHDRGSRYRWIDNHEYGPKPLRGFTIQWSSDTSGHLRDLEFCLRNEIERGRFSGEETDENGFTILFEFFNLLIILGEQWKDFERDLTVLLRTILQSHVDVLATTVFNENLRHYGIHSIGNSSCEHDDVTAVEYLMTRGHTLISQLGWEVPFYDQILSAGIVDGLQSVSRHDSANCVESYIYRELPLELLLQHIEVAEALEYDDLALAIIKRSYSVVKLLTTKPRFCSETEKIHRSRRTYLELALGWAEGIHYLMDRKFTPEPAIILACDLGDHLSLRILLTTKRPIFTRMRDPHQSSNLGSSLWVLREAVASRRRDILMLAASELRERRECLYRKAAEVYSQCELTAMCLNESTILSRKGVLNFRSMVKRASFPPGLAFDSDLSVYHFPMGFDYYMHAREPMLRNFGDVFNTLYDSGFTNVDETNNQDETPMFWHVKRSIQSSEFGNDTFDAGCIVDWFVGHGASVRNPADTGWPNILFYLALITSERPGYLRLDDWGSKKLKAAVANLQVHTDTCKCFCSSYGCLPIHLLLRCYFRLKNACVHNFGRLELFRLWQQKWKIHASQQKVLVKDVVRLELFERLGMAHTFCRPERIYQPDELVHPRRISDSEIQFMQLEDSELSIQLESLMDYYQDWSSSFRGGSEDFYEVWWRVVDEILPPLTADEGCESLHRVPYSPISQIEQEQNRNTGKELREMKEMEILRKSGFERFADFQSVIHAHFAKKRLEVFERDAQPKSHVDGES